MISKEIKKLKPGTVDAILKRTREVLENVELVQGLRLEIKLEMFEAPQLRYEVDEVVVEEK